MDKLDFEEQIIWERADKIVDRLFKALYSEEDGDTINYPTLMCALAKFTASVLLAVQEKGEMLDVEEDFMKVVKDVKASMGKDMKMQIIQEKRDEIKKKIKENEETIKELKREQEENLKRLSMASNDVLN